MPLLLDTLSQTPLTEDEAKECQSYLEGLLVNDVLLSTDNFTTSSAGNHKTVVEEIAELDQQQRQINDKLGDVTSNHRDILIQLEEDVSLLTTDLTATYPDRVRQMANPKIGAINVDKMMQQVRTSSSVLKHVDSILDVLELPSLARLCVSQGNYHEALEILILVKSYCIRFPNITAFKRIEAQVDAELHQMVKGLVRLLATNVKQHMLTKMFQILTKLDIGPPLMLQLLFLQGRYKFILLELALLKPLLKLPNKMTYLKRVVEVFREHGYASLFQYLSLFSQRTLPGLVSQFATQLGVTLVQYLLEHLSETIEHAENDNIDSLLLQLVYLAKSLSKFGASIDVILHKGLLEWVSPEDWLRNSNKTVQSHSI